MSSEAPQAQVHSPPTTDLSQLNLSPSDSSNSNPTAATASAAASRRMNGPPAPSPPLALPTSTVAPASPSGNRFGLALNFIKGRPRGLSNANGGSRSPGGTGSPGSELPPSPSGAERGGYGFPTLRRTMSKRTGSTATNGTAATPAGEPSRAHARSASQTGAPSSAETSQTRQAQPTAPTPGPTSTAEGAGPLTSVETHRLRLVPHLESSRSLHFEPIDRDLNAFNLLRVGRFTDRSAASSAPDPLRVAFKSKVVSRGHAEVWCDEGGKFFIKDTKSSSGTFLNHIRLSAPGHESRAYPLKDGDILQLGVDYQGGTEEIYRCVKMRVELNRSWQRGMNSFNTAALAQLRALGGGGGAQQEAKPKAATKAAAASSASVTDCCICLYPVTVCQALFIAPCSHVTHFKCIRPLIQQNYPGFSCPLCRTYADLEADVEIEPLEEDLVPAPVDDADGDQPMEPLEEQDEPRDSRAPSIRLLAESSRRSSLAMLSGDQLAALSSTQSRPQSVRASSTHSPEDEAADTTSADIELPGAVPMGIPMANSSETEAWLASAATPPNSTFLSTLADSNVPLSRYHAPVTLDMALNGIGTAGPSAATASVAAETSSFGSGTDAAREEEEIEGPAPVGREKSKGKGKAPEREGEENALEGEGKLSAESVPPLASDEMEGVLSM